MSLRELAVESVRRQAAKSDPDDPRGWGRSRLEKEVVRLREENRQLHRRFIPSDIEIEELLRFFHDETAYPAWLTSDLQWRHVNGFFHRLIAWWSDSGW